MDDRERMLAEGPREAPEPPTAEAMSIGEVKPVPAPSPPPPPARTGRPSVHSYRWFRLVPIAVVAVLTGVRALGDGFGGLVVVAVIVAVGLIEYLRRRNR